jgi:hypothetical protein
MRTAAAMPAVTMVHEQVHQGASQDQQVGQCAEYVRRVLGQQEESHYGKEERDAGALYILA